MRAESSFVMLSEVEASLRKVLLWWDERIKISRRGAEIKTDKMKAVFLRASASLREL
jgi:hypothetical protein